MNCADGKTLLGFSSRWAWIVDYAEHATLYGIGNRSCPRYEVPCKELGENLQKM